MGEDRSRRAQGWIGVAALAVLVAGVVYLRPSLGPPAAASPTAVRPPLAPAVWTLASVTFGDEDHGVVGFYRMNLPGPGPITSFLTSDAGRTWRQLAGDPGGIAVAGFLDGRTVLLQTATRGGPTNTRLSEDSGHTWRRLSDPRRLPGLGLPTFLDGQHGLWIERPPTPDPRSPAPTTLWRTSDGGRSWQRLAASGLPQTGFLGQLVLVDPLHGALVFTFPDGSRSWFATTDGGDSWLVVRGPDTPLPDTWTRSVIVLRHGGRLLAWLEAVSGSLSANGFLAAPNGTIDAAAFVSTSDDGGQTWGPPRAGPNSVESGYTSLIPKLDDRGRMLLLDNRHLWVSEDDGATWDVRVVQVPAGVQPAWLAGAPPGGLFAAAFQTGAFGVVTPSTPLTLIRSVDGGAHWSPLSLPRPP